MAGPPKKKGQGEYGRTRKRDRKKTWIKKIDKKRKFEQRHNRATENKNNRIRAGTWEAGEE